MKPELTLEEAADRLEMTVDELKRSRARGLPPGNLGYTLPPYDGTVYFRTADLIPPPPPPAEHVCDDCDFEAKSAGGLATHRRSHTPTPVEVTVYDSEGSVVGPDGGEEAFEADG